MEKLKASMEKLKAIDEFGNHFFYAEQRNVDKNQKKSSKSEFKELFKECREKDKKKKE